ncbi:MAG: aldo/keto reductase [Firmicutes bacterium]|nr:Fe-S oxidoreductase [Clostridiales bacterium]MBQ3123403.1 aldo/keto reductase [Bacillota bacterium]
MNKLGFGFLRMPKKNPDDPSTIDYELTNDMVDEFIGRGGKYFDSAYTYLDGYSEIAFGKCVADRYPRDAYIITTKLPGWLCKSYDDCKVYFDKQIERCHVDYFDNYFIHWLNKANYDIAEATDQFRFLREVKAAGKAKQIGFSYHDNAELLDEILTKHPEVDLVQLQINYLDWETVSIDAKGCYEVCVKHNKPVIVMEPIKGGTLATLPPEAEALLREVHPDETNASWALRFVQSLDQVEILLSGMNSVEQIIENIECLDDKPAMPEEEVALLMKAADIINSNTAIPCTGCRYCIEDPCPMGIVIPDYFALYNEHKRYPDDDWKLKPVYNSLKAKHGIPADCIGCKKCEGSCPQKIKITDFLPKIADEFKDF